jgi:hypothetical protein
MQTWFLATIGTTVIAITAIKLFKKTKKITSLAVQEKISQKSIFPYFFIKKENL